MTPIDPVARTGKHRPDRSWGATSARTLHAAVALFAMATSAHSMEINTGNPDVALRWDNTLRYNLGQRVQDQNRAILANPNFDDSDRNFGNHSMVANRLDLLSELESTD